MFKTVVVGALALLLGIFLGGIAPRVELRKVKTELAEARAAAEENRGGGSVLPMLPGLLGADRPERRPPPRFEVDRSRPESERDEPPLAADEPRDAGGDGGRRGRRFFGSDGFAAAKAAADARAAQFRAAFLEEARLPPEKQAALDTAVKKMNEELAKSADELAQSLREKNRTLTPRDMADVAAKVIDVYRRGDDGLQGILDDAGRAAAAKTEFDMLTQIDVGAFKNLGEVVEALGVNPPGGRRRGGDE